MCPGGSVGERTKVPEVLTGAFLDKPLTRHTDRYPALHGAFTDAVSRSGCSA